MLPGTGQSSDFSFAPMGQRSKQPNVTTRQVRATKSGDTSLGFFGPSSTPTSLSSEITVGLIVWAGCTPALSACQPLGAWELKIASLRTLRKVFSTQTKRTTLSPAESVRSHRLLYPSILALAANINRARAATAEVAMLNWNAAPDPKLVHKTPKTEFATSDPTPIIV